MKIIKYTKVGQGKYELLLEDESKIKLYEDVILKEGLLLTKEIEDLDKILQINEKYAIYDIALKYLNHHVISIKGMKDYLRKKAYQEEDINNIVDKLIHNGYLNDSYYAKCYINDHLHLSMDGPNKIKKNLILNDISDELYQEYMSFDNNFWINRINKYIEKQKKINKKSEYLFKNKMLLNLINLGYDKELIDSCLNSISIDNKKELYEKEKEKIRKKLERKYSGDELERKIKEKLYSRGFFE